MQSLSIDIESYSSIDLSASGVYKYAEAPDFEILLFAYCVDGGEINVVDLANGEEIQQEIIEALTDDTVIKWAFNANFERVCLSQYLGKTEFLNPKSWRCSMIWSAYMGMPRSLQDVGSILGLEKQKLSEGKELIKYFCVPCKPTKANGERLRNLPAHAPDKWELFKAYNRRDVEVEMAIKDRLGGFPVPDFVWEEYTQDQEINDRGVLIDMELADNAIAMDERSKEEITRRVKELTSVENPNSVLQMKQWLNENGLEVDSLDKKEVEELAKNAPANLRKVLELRGQLAKSSINKYRAMQNAVCDDGRARGMFRFYGANRTGRWSGQLIQMQNLKRNSLPDLEAARELVKNGDYEAVEMLYSSVPDVLSELVRTAFVPRANSKLVVADFSAIEARVIAWLAGEKWRNEVFATHGKIYEASAAQMFKVPIEEITKDSPLRQKGKQAELACIAENELVLTNKGLVPIQNVTTEHKLWDGEEWVKHQGVIYKGEGEVIEYEGLRATADHIVWVEGQKEPMTLLRAAANNLHLTQTSITPVVSQGPRMCRVYDILNAGRHNRFTVSGKLVHNCGYGGANGALRAMGALEMGLTEDDLYPLVKAWREANPNIVKLWWDVDSAVKEAVSLRTTTQTHGIKFSCCSGMLFITLPSGRNLSYVKPQIGMNKFGSDCVTYEGIGATKKWERLDGYGPKFVENIVQAISRDLLAFAMKGQRHCRIVMHIHDEIVIEADEQMSAEAVCEQMSITPDWAKGLILKAEGYEAMFYKK